MSVAVDADLADGDGGVSPKHQLTPRPTRSSRISPPPIPPAASTTQEGAGAVGAAGPAGHDGGEDAEHHTSGHEAAAATEPFPSMGGRNGGLSSFNLRADPDAQATVTDFLDFTEYLPSDMARSLTLIGKLDEDYVEASTNVHKLTDAWGQLPNMAAESRPSATKLRADISANLTHGINARVYAHAEALRMAENVNRHYFRAKTILSKLQTMLENYPEAEQQQQAQLQQKQQQQQQQREQEQQQQLQNQEGQKQPKKSSNGQQRMRRQRVPRITVPGEVLAPYDLDYESYSGESDVSSPSSDDESLPPHPGMRRKSTSAAPPRMKGLKGALSGSAIGGSSSGGPHSLKVPKVRVPRESRVPGQPYISTSSALARLKPPPENAVVGSADAPWLRLTAYELAKLRKRMKKNAQWSPSDTMIARELKALGRNLDAFNQARKKAEAEGRVFEGILPDAALELGAMNMDAALAAEESQLTNRGIRLNEAKKMKNDLGSLAAQEAEESTRRMMEAARAIFSPYPGATPDTTASAVASARATTPAATSRKRKREGPTDATVADTVEGGAADNGVSGEATAATSTPVPSAASQRQLQKRVKTETPVPIPQPAKGSAPPHDAASSSNNTLATPAPPTYTRHSMTPVPAPVFGGGASSQAQDPSQSRQSTAMSSPLSSGASTGTGGNANTTTTTTTVPLKPPAETPIHPPVHKSTTPIHPPVRELRTREPARKDLPIHQQQPAGGGEDAEDLAAPPRASRASSRALTPNPVNALGIVNIVLPTTETGSAGTTLATAGPTTTRRPSSRGASASAPNPEGQSLASERPRRASTARNTPVPDVVGKRVKRPAPGVVSRTSSGGSAAVGQRKAAPRKKRRSNAHQNPPQNLNQSQNQNQQRRDSRGKSTDGDDVEIDDDGNIIDANEPRYCVCNRVSFGTMIQCDNVDEWFHLECVGLTAVPARTTKWYCPDCRVLLNIGEKGEVSARGVKA